MLELTAGGARGTELPPTSPPTATTERGKLDSSNTEDQVSEGKKFTVQTPIYFSLVTGGYRLPSSVNGTNLNLLLDTGAAVTLLREDVWRQIAPQPPKLESWDGAALVSAGGMPLSVYGCVSVNLGLEGKQFKTKMVVVSPLNLRQSWALIFSSSKVIKRNG